MKLQGSETSSLETLQSAINLRAGNRFSVRLLAVLHRRLNNFDWPDDWVFAGSQFNLLDGDDEIFLRFLCETVHPVVRSDRTEVERLVQLYNSYLSADGFQLVEKSRMSGRPIYVGREVGIISTPGVSAVRNALATVDVGYVAQQITRMEAAVNEDPNSQ